jgi:hypothetical protein
MAVGYCWHLIRTRLQECVVHEGNRRLPPLRRRPSAVCNAADHELTTKPESIVMQGCSKRGDLHVLGEHDTAWSNGKILPREILLGSLPRNHSTQFVHSAGARSSVKMFKRVSRQKNYRDGHIMLSPFVRRHLVDRSHHSMRREHPLTRIQRIHKVVKRLHRAWTELSFDGFRLIKECVTAVGCSLDLSEVRIRINRRLRTFIRQGAQVYFEKFTFFG